MNAPRLEDIRRVSELGLPLQLFGAWVRLRLEGGSFSTREAAERFAVTERTVRLWVRDLGELGLVEQGGGRVKALRALDPGSDVAEVKNRADGKPQRCAGCRVIVRTLRRGGTGAFCSKCKQAHRADSAWWLEAEPLLRDGLSPQSVCVRLENSGTHCPLWDYTPRDRSKRMPGLVTRGVRAGLLGEEWLARQKYALDGGDDAEGWGD